MKSTLLILSSILFLFLTVADGQAQNQLIDDDATPEIISEGHQFTEGPYWHPDGYLLFSDIPANHVYRWDPETGNSEVYIEPSGNSNGIQADIDGTVILAQHAGRLSRLTSDMELETIVDNYNGNRLNSPNDLAIHSSGTIYFTDPPFGVEDEERELDFSGVYMITPDGELTLFYDEFDYPNGIVLSPDESKLYVNNSETGDITVFDVDENGIPSSGSHFANVGPWSQGGTADGMVTDMDGRVYTTGPAGISVFAPDGSHLQDIGFDQSVSNLEWSGSEPGVLYITSRDLVYRLQLNTEGFKAR